VPEVYEQRVYQLNLMVPKASPFVKTFNNNIISYVKAGMNVQAIRRAYAENEPTLRLRNGEIPETIERLIIFEDLVRVFVTYLCLIGICYVVFE
jgi:hypothetical protein